MMKGWLLASAALLLTACAHDVDVTDGLSFDQRQAALAAVTDWTMRGRLIVDTGDRRDRVRVVWEQRGGELSLTIRPTIGMVGNFRIEGSAERLQIQGRGETRILEDPEIDLSLELGWWLPVTSLEHWLMGRPDRNYPDRVNRGRAGTLSALDQRDWQVEYRAYQLVDGLLLPRQLQLSHRDLELDLEITDWTPAGI